MKSLIYIFTKRILNFLSFRSMNFKLIELSLRVRGNAAQKFERATESLAKIWFALITQIERI